MWSRGFRICATTITTSSIVIRRVQLEATSPPRLPIREELGFPNHRKCLLRCQKVALCEAKVGFC